MVKVKVKSLSCVPLFATPWIVAHQAPPSMGFSRQEYWSVLPFPSPGESSQPRDRTHVSHIAGRRFNLWATREFLVNVFHSELQFAITCYRGPKIITHPNTCYTLLLWLDIPQQRMYLKRVQELHHFTGFPGQCWGATSVQGRFLFSRQVRY